MIIIILSLIRCRYSKTFNSKSNSLFIVTNCFSLPKLHNEDCFLPIKLFWPKHETVNALDHSNQIHNVECRLQYTIWTLFPIRFDSIWFPESSAFDHEPQINFYFNSISQHVSSSIRLGLNYYHDWNWFRIIPVEFEIEHSTRTSTSKLN